MEGKLAEDERAGFEADIEVDIKAGVKTSSFGRKAKDRHFNPNSPGLRSSF